MFDLSPFNKDMQQYRRAKDLARRATTRPGATWKAGTVAASTGPEYEPDAAIAMHASEKVELRVLCHLLLVSAAEGDRTPPPARDCAPCGGRASCDMRDCARRPLRADDCGPLTQLVCPAAIDARLWSFDSINLSGCHRCTFVVL